MDDYEYITSKEALQEASKHWNEPELAIDLEMEANFHHFGIHLSLIQISSLKQTWLIDALVIKDLTCVINMLENPSIQKVFHDVSFDFRILHQVLNCSPKNVFDTKIAAELLGRKNVSLGALLEEEFGLHKDSACQKADWLTRPLQKTMLDYAARDTAHLLALKKILHDQLVLQGRMTWMKEECTIIEQTDHSNNTPTFHNIKGSKSLTDIERARLAAMYILRDKLAEQLDKPVFFVIRDKKLLELASKPPASIHHWRTLTGVHPLVKRHAQEFYSAISTAQPVKKLNSKRKLRLTPDEEAQVEQWIAKRDKVASVLRMTNHLVITREQMERLVRTKDYSVLKNWQKKALEIHS